MKNENFTGSCPVAFIAKNKQRAKQYNDIVYLKNGEEFEIELFNPTQSKVLARISINNSSIGPGIILRPGERIFLERYVNDPRKFKFETYTVNSNDKQVKKAIENNGDINVEFFKEEESKLTISDIESINRYFRYTTTPESSAVPETNIFYQNSSDVALQSISTLDYPLKNYDMKIGTFSCTSFNPSSFNNSTSANTSANTSASTSINTTASSYTNSLGFYDTSYSAGLSKLSSKSNDIETGRIEKGSSSNQKFDKDYTKFNRYSSWTSKWKILPESRKQFTSEDLVMYCTCGRKQRKNENFCPSCGKKFGKMNVDLKLNDTVIILEKNSISVIEEISKNGNNENIYYVKYPGDNRWYTKNQLEFRHSN